MGAPCWDMDGDGVPTPQAPARVTGSIDASDSLESEQGVQGGIGGPQPFIYLFSIPFPNCKWDQALSYCRICSMKKTHVQDIKIFVPRTDHSTALLYKNFSFCCWVFFFLGTDGG